MPVLLPNGVVGAVDLLTADTHGRLQTVQRARNCQSMPCTLVFALHSQASASTELRSSTFFSLDTQVQNPSVLKSYSPIVLVHLYNPREFSLTWTFCSASPTLVAAAWAPTYSSEPVMTAASPLTRWRRSFALQVLAPRVTMTCLREESSPQQADRS